MARSIIFLVPSKDHPPSMFLNEGLSTFGPLHPRPHVFLRSECSKKVETGAGVLEVTVW